MSTEQHWPADWPEDAKTGAAFLRELHRRNPALIQVGTLEQGIEWMKQEDKKDEPE